MPAGLLLPRRLAIALVLALVLGSGTVLAAGFGEPVGDIPASWGVPVPRVGDAGNYTYSFVDADGQATLEVPYLDFKRHPVATEYAQDGSRVTVHRLERWQWHYRYDTGIGDGTPGWTWSPGFSLTVANDPDGHSPFIETAMDQALGAEGTGGDVAGVPIRALAQEGQLAFRGRVYADDETQATVWDDWLAESMLGLCGARNALQGTEVPLREGMRLVDSCQLRIGGVDPARLQFPDNDRGEQDVEAIEVAGHDLFLFDDQGWTPLGQQDVGGKPAVAFARSASEPGQGSHKVRLWFARDIPYPVQVAVQDDDGVHLLRLTGFQAGSGPIEFPAPAPLPAPPGITAAPREPYGMDDRGLGLHVPASAAWQAALDEGSLARFLDDHPAALLVQARTYVMRNDWDASESGRSTFVVSDGQEVFGVTVRSTYDPPVAVPTMLGLPVEPVGAEPTFEVEVGFTDSGPVVFPAAGLPDRLPTVASLAQRLLGFTRMQDIPVASWELTLACQGESVESGLVAACDDVTINLSVLAWRTAISPNATTPTAPSLDYTLPYARGDFAPDGTPSGLWTAMGEASTSVLPVALAPATEAPYEDPGNSGRGWSMPPAQVVAVAGFVGLLAALAYLLWPLAKGGAVGLYARVTGDEVLEHPLRQRILGVVEATPGIHLKEIARQTGLAWGQTQHHVGKLVQAGVLVARPTSGYTCYFPKGQDRHVMGAAHVLKADGARRLLSHIAGTTGLSMGQLARAAGLTESTAHYHLKRLEAAGLVSTQLVGGARRATLTALGAEAGRRYGGAAAVAAS